MQVYKKLIDPEEQEIESIHQWWPAKEESTRNLASYIRPLIYRKLPILMSTKHLCQDQPLVSPTYNNTIQWQKIFRIFMSELGSESKCKFFLNQLQYNASTITLLFVLIANTKIQLKNAP